MAKPNFIHQINNQPYYLEVYLYNQINEPWAVPILAIDELCIEETLSNWTTTGYIVLNNPFEVLERGSLAVTTNDGTILQYSPNPVLFRGDGRNKLSIRIYPLDEKFSSAPFPKNKWEMCYDFAIYEIEDIPTGNNQKKLKKLNFWDERYQIFSERNIEYSSVYTSLKKNQISYNPAFLPEVAKLANPSKILMDIISTASNNPPVMKKLITDTTGGNKIKIGFKQGGSIKNPTEKIDVIDEKNWDVGQGDLVFFTSPAKSKATWDIKYILDLIVAKDGGPVFLNLGRSSDDKKWKLQSISTLFKNSQKDQIERLIIEDSLVTGKPYQSRSFTGMSEDNSVNFTSAYASRITDYSYSPMAAADDARITNSPVHYYDFDTGTFNIKYEKNTAKIVKDDLEKYAKEGLYSYKKGQGQIKLILNQTKQKGIQTTPIFTPHKYFPENYGSVKMKKDALMLNESINFQVLGLTLRTPGKFMFIDSPTTSDGELNPFHDKFYGQWLITKVKHIFTQDSYLTDVVGIKIDSYQKVYPDNDVKN
jgi:hypothetical protein